MAVAIDIVEGNTGRESADGLELDRIATITGIEGDASRKIVIARNTAGVPRYGDPHPAETSCKLRTIRFESLSTDIVKAYLHYSQKSIDRSAPPGDPPQIEVGSTLSQVSSNKDISGNEITVAHTFPSTDDDWPDEKKEQSVPVSRLVPESSLTYNQTEYNSPGTKSRYYVGRMNAAPWQGGATKTWLCTSIVGRSNDGGFTFSVAYTVQYRGDTWDGEVVYIDPRTGRPPANLENGVGKKRVVIYQTANFDNAFS